MAYCQCRICLADGAKHKIFTDMESKQSIYAKIFQCFNENIKHVEGYPDKICDTCNTTLNTLFNFIIKYKTSSKLLECGLVIVKKESNDSISKNCNIKQEYDVEIFKEEPLSDSDNGLDHNDDVWEPEPQKKCHNKRLAEIKAKLESLREINIKKKPTERSKKRNDNNLLKKKTRDVTSKICTKSVDIQEECKSEPKVKKQGPLQTSKLCDTCGMVFEKRSKLAAHRRTHLNSNAKCELCKRVFRTDAYLRRHMASFHADKKLFCETCGKGYTHKGGLIQHIKNIHIGRKKLKCDKCDKFFLYAKGLLIHDRAEHLKIRPAVCEICGADFVHDDYLKEHMRLHTGETPFKCPVCSKGFAQRCNMKSHIKHNHRLVDLSPEMKKTLKPAWFKYFKTL